MLSVANKPVKLYVIRLSVVAPNEQLCCCLGSKHRA
jgi:hypothetical protein